MTALQAAALWTGLLVLLMVVLSVRVMLARRRHRISLGDAGSEPMQILTRGFGNAAEYIPIAAATLILLALLETAPTTIHILGGALFLGRLVHPLGLAMKAPNWARVAGMALTWISLIAAGVLLLIGAFAA